MAPALGLTVAYIIIIKVQSQLINAHPTIKLQHPWSPMLILVWLNLSSKVSPAAVLSTDYTLPFYA